MSDMRLLQFRVTGFRSVEDSGWIDVDDLIALTGAHATGKTNLLTALAKLHPVRDAEIIPTRDYPSTRYSEIHAQSEKPVFIEADFALSVTLTSIVAALAGAEERAVDIVRISRGYDSRHEVTFPNALFARAVPRTTVVRLLTAAGDMLSGLASACADQNALLAMQAALHMVASNLEMIALQPADLARVQAELASAACGAGAGGTEPATIFRRLHEALAELYANAVMPGPGENPDIRDLVLRHMPHFVYYAPLGNLESRVYLPRLSQLTSREELSPREAATARTLEALLAFLTLDPRDITERRKDASSVLASASHQLSDQFPAWHKRESPRFRFEVKGDWLYIWVTDIHGHERALEQCSADIQWALSLYLITRFESSDSPTRAVLLLDDPGLSLHPLAQKDLLVFLKILSSEQQIVYTTHSPFLIDPGRLDRTKAVLLDPAGATFVPSSWGTIPSVSSNGEWHAQAAYPARVAISQAASPTLLRECDLVVVEGEADPIYLNAIKNILMRDGTLRPRREIIFSPAGDEQALAALACVLEGPNAPLPLVLLDGNQAGELYASRLRAGLYREAGSLVYLINEYGGPPVAEIEDLVPFDVMSRVVTRWLRLPNNEFSDIAASGIPIVAQIETNVARRGVGPLSHDWKVQLAELVEPALAACRLADAGEERAGWWRSLFKSLFP